MRLRAFVAARDSASTVRPTPRILSGDVALSTGQTTRSLDSRRAPHSTRVHPCGAPCVEVIIHSFSPLDGAGALLRGARLPGGLAHSVHGSAVLASASDAVELPCKLPSPAPYRPRWRTATQGLILGKPRSWELPAAIEAGVHGSREGRRDVRRTGEKVIAFGDAFLGVFGLDAEKRPLLPGMGSPEGGAVCGLREVVARRFNSIRAGRRQ